MSKSSLMSFILLLLACATALLIVSVTAYSNDQDSLENTAWGFVSYKDQGFIYVGLNSVAFFNGNGFDIIKFDNGAQKDTSTAVFSLLIISLAFLLPLFLSTFLRMSSDSKELQAISVIIAAFTFVVLLCAWVSWYIKVFKETLEDFTDTAGFEAQPWYGFGTAVTACGLLLFVAMLHQLSPVSKDNLTL